MLSTYRRYGFLLALLLLTGLAGAAVGSPERVPPLPPMQALVAHSGWSIDRQSPPICLASRPSVTTNTAVCVVDNARGVQAQLYVGAESIQKTVHWSGELGYAGAGYLATQRGVTTVRLRDGRVVPVSFSIEQRLTDRELEEYVVIASSYIAAHSTDNLPRDAWDVIRGHSGPYFVVRVSIPSPSHMTDDGVRQAAGLLLQPVIARLSAVARGQSA